MSPRRLKWPLGCAIALLVFGCATQLQADEPRQTGGLSSNVLELGGQTAPSPETAQAQPAPTLKGLPKQIVRDQKFLWPRPFRIKRSDLPWLGLLVGTTAGLISVDRRVGQGLSDSPPGAGYTFSKYVGWIGSPLTDLGIAGAFYVVGHRDHDRNTQNTGLLGLQAVTDSLVVVEVLKVITQRPRPTRSGGEFRNHNADGEFFTGGMSFPSGHAASAFAIATVVAERASEKRWVAPVAYGLAGLVSASRISLRAHFPSDVFVGASLGFLIGRYVVHSAVQPARDKSLRSRLIPVVTSAGGRALALSWEF